MASRRFHYERAFEHYLRSNAVAYVAVDEAKRALSPPGESDPQTGADRQARAKSAVKLKSFDFVVYSQTGRNLLVDVKGRKHSGKTGRAFQNWVTRDDVRGLERWAEIFGEGFEPAFAFLFWCEAQPPDALFHEVFAYADRWYAVLAARLSEYRPLMRDRSAKWDTVSIPAAGFRNIARPLQELL
ncbi:MAG: HYExAFE family protein [Planctomycetota bacterium]